MESWQFVYLAVVGVGFLIGWFLSPIVAVVFVWVCIIASESLNYWREMREFEEEYEES